MTSGTYRVALVMHPDFGKRLDNLCRQMHVWLRESQSNEVAAQRNWGSDGDEVFSTRSGVTTFSCSPDESLETCVVNILDTIDQHHDSYDEEAGWEVIEVYGFYVTDRIRDYLQELGVTQINTTDDGFVCIREFASNH